jgi:lactoylglutathione lyase
LELMQIPELAARAQGDFTGLAHVAFSAGSRAAVGQLTAALRNAGHRIVSQPRVTGDGYYESVVADPDGNIVEITV